MRDEARAAELRCFHPHLAAVPFDDPLHDRKPKAKSCFRSARAFELYERIEHARTIFHRNARPIVLDGEHTERAARREFHLDVLTRVAYGVVEHVTDRRFHEMRIAADRSRSVIDLAMHFDIALRRSLRVFTQRLQHPGEVVNADVQCDFGAFENCVVERRADEVIELGDVAIYVI